jgi:hypothetical protein
MNAAWEAMLARVEKRRDVDARYYKPVCLIAVIDGIADGSLAPSDIEPDRVVARFAAYVGNLFPGRAALGWRPFWHLSRDGAWIFTREGRLVGPEDFKKQRKPDSRRELMSKIDMVAVPPTLRCHWRSASDRAELRAAVIAMLRRDNEDCRLIADHLDTGVALAETLREDAEIVPASDGKLPGGRQGFRRSLAARRAVEARGMAVATALLTAQGWTVEDVCTKRCYDLHCERGLDRLFVEVKGTTGAGAEIQLTAGEVAFATRNQDEMILIVVAGIKLKEEGGEATASGGHAHLLPQWAPAPGDLDPISYHCRLQLPGAL